MKPKINETKKVKHNSQRVRFAVIKIYKKYIFVVTTTIKQQKHHLIELKIIEPAILSLPRCRDTCLHKLKNTMGKGLQMGETSEWLLIAKRNAAPVP